MTVVMTARAGGHLLWLAGKVVTGVLPHTPLIEVTLVDRSGGGPVTGGTLSSVLVREEGGRGVMGARGPAVGGTPAPRSRSQGRSGELIMMPPLELY
ncbi:hypothetical protein SKAU_G00106430 [Synaphobranchus kaupii]|uniref:Uncharacterized protein n=1 Tax=Synaphobranchus kaupii TaxID=118154 RepID=A0A9Q1G0F5_SYNKA|nr:hypothetical protein SKAU_G00106430 [Synaphobranchus kaupii]